MINNSQIWRFSEKDASITKALLITTDKYARVMGICLGLIVTAGIIMMSKMHTVYGGQIWLRIKIGLAVVIIIFRILNRRNYKQIKSRLTSEIKASVTDIKKRINLFEVAQLVLIGSIIILSVFRFS
jgi:uncharacterized membrane protein